MRKVFAVLLALGLTSSLVAQTTLIDQGRAALNKNDAERAAELLEKAVAETPNSAEAHSLLGEAYGTMAQKASLFKQPGLARKTRDEFERAVQLDPNHLEARMGLIDFYLLAPGFMGGDEQKAFAQATEIRKRDMAMGHRAFARIYLRQKKPDLARKEYTDSVKEQASSPKTHFALGAFLFANDKNYSAAMQEFENAIKLEPTHMPSWFQLGHVAALSGSNMVRGEEALRRYLAYTPGHDEPPLARAHFWLGVIQEKEGRKTEARQSYTTSLRLNPNQKDVAEALKRVS